MLHLIAELSTGELRNPIHEYLVVTSAVSTADSVVSRILNSELVLSCGDAELIVRLLVGAIRAPAPNKPSIALVDEVPCRLAAIVVRQDLHLDGGL